MGICRLKEYEKMVDVTAEFVSYEPVSNTILLDIARSLAIIADNTTDIKDSLKDISRKR